MDIFELIKSRRSVFPNQFTGQPIAKNTLQKILETANWAPTHRKTEPWRFKVVQGQAKQKLAAFVADEMQKADPTLTSFKLKNTLQKFEASAAVVVICMQRDPKESIPEWEEVAATAMAVQNLWLTCTAEHIGGYWSSPGVMQQFHKFFKFHEGERCLGLFYMGYIAGNVSEGIRKTSIDEKTEWLD